MMSVGCWRQSVAFLVLFYYVAVGQVPSTQYEEPHRRFEYKYSFKGPYLAQKDGTVPFWEYEGNTIASDEMVRITPSLRSKKGSIWTKSRTNFEWWEVELWFRVSGRGRLGADGLAFWFTDVKGTDGPVFGSRDAWRGLGIFFDSFDNDAKGNNPYIMAMVNDGTKIYDHQTDGGSQQLAGCLRDFRNKPFPVRAKIEYYHNTLTLMFHSGNSNNENEYEQCFRVDNVHLPQSGHFGMSAATGGLADDHDVLKLLTYSLSAPSAHQAQGGIADAEKDRYAREYEQYKDKLERQKEDYFRQHPDEARKMREQEDALPDHEFESLGERELQQIFNGQSSMFDTLKDLNRKLDQIIGRQERTMSMINSAGTVGVQQQPGQQHIPAPPAGGQIPMQRHEFESLMGYQQELLQNTRDIRTSVAQGLPSQGQPASVQQANQMSAQLLTETRDGINVLRRELAGIMTKLMARDNSGPAPSIACPTLDCLSTSMFIVFLFLHLAVLIGYQMYRQSKEAAAKKFY